MKKLIAFSVLVVLALAITACDIGPVTFGQVEIIPTVTEEINVPLPAEGDTSQVHISMGGGDLFINVGDVDGLVKGTVTYNVEEIKPRCCDVARRTTAPAPSPKSTHVLRSCQSVNRVRVSAAMTNTLSYTPPRMNCVATVKA